jgi:hypothetical protein
MMIVFELRGVTHNSCSLQNSIAENSSEGEEAKTSTIKLNLMRMYLLKEPQKEISFL